MSEQVNISRKYIEGKCDLKCAYNFNYTSTNATAINSGESISIRGFDKTDTPPVLYNKQKYNIFSLELYYPSSFLYNDKLADAELRIIHFSETISKGLAVFIPIKVSSDSTSATIQIKDVIKSVSVSAPSNGQEVTISNVNLQDIVPNKPFFNYTPENRTNIIVFGFLDAISISSSSLDTLKQICKPSKMIAKISQNEGLFYNSSGPNTTKSIGDGIYISCNPTGNSIETKEVTYEKNNPIYDIGDILENPNFILVVQTLLACLVFIVICYIWNYGYKFIDGDFATSDKPNVKG